MPVAIVGFVGVTSRETRVAEFTARFVELDTLLKIAVMVVEPAATALTIPIVPAVLLIDATEVLDELQVTLWVMSCVVLSEKTPLAVN